MTRINPRFPDELPTMSHRDRRNVIDHYKSMHDDLVRGDLAKKRSPLVSIVENFASDYNLATCIRNANAFVARETWIVGRRRWDRRGAVGTHNFETVNHAPDIEPVVARLKNDGYTIVGIDNVERSQSIYEYSFPEKTAMIFGQEQIGVSNQSLDLCDDILFIPMFGSVRSLNVGVAAGISMYEYARQWNVGTW